MAAGLWLSGLDTGWRLDGLFFDNAVRLMGAPRKVPDYAVILITEQEYKQKATPFALWGKHLTPLLRRLIQDKPKAVGLDLLLPQFSLAWVARKLDQDFFKSLKELSKVTRLVSGYGINAAGQANEPFIFYQRILGPEGYGFFNLSPDPDLVCRRHVLLKSGTKGEKLYAFPALLSGRELTGKTVEFPDWRYPAQFMTYAFSEAIKAAPGVFQDKTILVGVQLDFEDRCQSPAAPRGEPGVIFQARVAEALSSGRSLQDPGWFISSLMPGVIGLLALLIFTRRASVTKIALSGAGITIGLLLACYASLWFGMFFRPFAAVAAVAGTASMLILSSYAMVRESFGRYVSRRVRDEILSGRVSLGGETKYVTVLFADLVGFTPLTASHPPQEVVSVINRYFHEMSLAIQKEDGLVLQYVGDEVFAVFGAPLPCPDQADRALKAAFAMCSRLDSLNHLLRDEGKPQLRHGIGLHCGEVVAGNIGGGGRLSYALVGDTVNMGSRIQGLTRKLDARILISQDLKEKLTGDYQLEELPPTRVKGKDEPMRLFRVI